MKQTLTKLAGCVAIACVACNVTIVRAADADRDSYPHMIVCDVQGAHFFGYLDRIEADGQAFYIMPSGKRGGIVKNNVFNSFGGTTGDCEGKTLKELIESGQARFIGK